MGRSDILSPEMLTELKRLAVKSHPQIYCGEFFLMGVGELREAFNSVAKPAFTATLALLDYERIGTPPTEWQVLLFRGISAEGASFEIKSDRLRADVDVNQAAKETAQRLLDQRNLAP